MNSKEYINTYYKTVILVLLVIATGAYGYSNLNYNWQWYRVPDYIVFIENGRLFKGLLVKGLIITLKISFISLILTAIIGFSTAFMRLSSSPVLKFATITYIEIVRNTPLLIQLFLIYFVISPVIGLSPFFSAVIALSLFEGAYASEMIRSGILSIPKGQWEASYSLGLSTTDTYVTVVMPQVMRQGLPMLAGQSVSLVKDSALVSTISIFDLTMQGQSIVSKTFLTFEIWFTVAFMYFCITASLSLLIARFEKRLNYHV